LSVKDCDAFGALPLAAFNVNEYDPALPAGGVPDMLAVPSPLSVTVSHAGTVPLVVIVGVGRPDVVTVNDPALPTTNVALFALVNAGGLPTVNVAALEVALPAALVNTARYWLPLSVAAAVNVYVVLVAKAIFENPEPVLRCHCTVGVGEPDAPAVNETD
jgi:hypothetical protein